MDKYYVSGCVDNGIDIETVEDAVAEFWTLYERDEKGLSHALLDCVDRLSVDSAMAVYMERDALQEQVHKQAAENSNMRKAIDQTIGWMESVDPENEESVRLLVDLKTPATDAAIREIRAQGVDIAESHLSKKFSNIGVQIMTLQWLSKAIRAGEQP